MPKGLEEVYEMMNAMAQAQRGMAESLMTMASDLDAAVQKAETGSDITFGSSGDVTEDRMAEDIETPEKAVKVIKIALGRK